MYSDRYGEETAVVRMHSGNGAHDEMNRRAIACFDQALADVGLADDSALRQVLHEYFAWATTTTMFRYHRSNDDVPGRSQYPTLVIGWDSRRKAPRLIPCALNCDKSLVLAIFFFRNPTPSVDSKPSGRRLQQKPGPQFFVCSKTVIIAPAVASSARRCDKSTKAWYSHFSLFPVRHRVL
jgi:hypothetical protein